MFEYADWSLGDISLLADINADFVAAKILGGVAMSLSFQKIHEEIVNDSMNQNYTAQGIEPLYAVSEEAQLLIVGQAPGQKAQDSHRLFNDASGERLREWLGVTATQFYDAKQIAIMPMDFYFPGKGKSGDLPPRKGFAEKYHPLLLSLMPQIRTTILIGSYAQHFYLHTNESSTEIIRNFRDYLPRYFPLVHPSPRNNIWLARNPWFSQEVLPELKRLLNVEGSEMIAKED